MAALLVTYGPIKLRTRNQVSPDPEVTELLADLDFATRIHAREVARATKPDAPVPAVASSLSVERAASSSGVSRTAIRKALVTGRLTGQKDENGVWHVDPTSLEAYAPKQRPTRENRMTHVEAVAEKLVSARDAILGALDAPDAVGDVVRGLSIAAGSLAILAEALDSISPEDRTRMHHALTNLSAAEFEAMRDEREA
ncbi:hypothetical protein [Microbacterium hydrothermale]|uniref:hypothetical protein n=1 Tax=Microbacterium hydrothermale TaxID=857427 RepID=UPI0022274092|nr:hypothetical protein [Microbacterium hydrothermale]